MTNNAVSRTPAPIAMELQRDVPRSEPESESESEVEELRAVPIEPTVSETGAGQSAEAQSTGEAADEGKHGVLDLTDMVLGGAIQEEGTQEDVISLSLAESDDWRSAQTVSASEGLAAEQPAQVEVGKSAGGEPSTVLRSIKTFSTAAPAHS